MAEPESGGAGENRDSFDKTYLKSREGILRAVGIAVAAVGMVFIIASLFVYSGGWYFFVGFGFIVYSVIVIVIESCIPNVFVHRLIDAIIMFALAALWFLSAILNTVFGIKNSHVLLGIAAVFAYICGGIAIAQGVFSILAWKGGHQGSDDFTAVESSWWIQ